MSTSLDLVDFTVRQRVTAARRIVIKMGTNVIMRDDNAPAVGIVYGIVESAVNVLRSGRQVLIVSSGAIGLGAKSLRLEKSPSELALKQACAAVGQSRLDGFRPNVITAQVLLTEDDFLNPVRYSNLRATLDTLLKLGVVPIINENDTVSTLELDRPSNAEGQHRVFGDNDKLSALVMTKIDADLLVLLSDVDGLYTGHPHDDGAELVSEVEEITPALAAYARISKGRGRGGMSTKIEAARIVAEAGKVTVIANGRIPGVVERVVAGESIGTVFHPRPPHVEDRA
jgi:glutamate 5-kinase